MDELQYEQAIAEYRAAIEIEPNNAEAYLALAEVYVQTGDYESAIAVLEQGIEQTDSEELSGYIEEVRAAQAAAEEAALQEEQAAREEQAASEEESAGENQQEEEPEESAEESGSREETVYNEDGSYWVNEYDGNGNLVKDASYNADGTVSWVGEYDGNGNNVKTTYYNADGTVDSVYDGDGNRIE